VAATAHDNVVINRLDISTFRVLFVKPPFELDEREQVEAR
jgi:hypothetical protein